MIEQIGQFLLGHPRLSRISIRRKMALRPYHLRVIGNLRQQERRFQTAVLVLDSPKVLGKRQSGQSRATGYR